MEKRLFVDMDGTLAVFQPTQNLETLYEKGYFANLRPMERVLNGVKSFIVQHPDVEVYVLSSYLSDSQFALQEKNNWLDKYLPEIPIDHRIFPPCGSNKKDFVPNGVTEQDYLLDDYTFNLNQWEPPARGIKLLNGINHTRGTWKNQKVNAFSCTIADDIFNVIEQSDVVKRENILPISEEMEI